MNAVTALPIYSAFALVFWVGLALTIIPTVRQAVAGLLLPPAATNQTHLAGLDALRGIAALFVAVFHTWQWTAPAFNGALEWASFIAKGYKAVPIFVSLSGLLIYRSLVSTNDIDGLRNYIARRFMRVFPVYIATVCAAFIFIGHFQSGAISFRYFIADASMMRSFGFASFTNPTAWSLYVEVLFYLVAPMFVIASRANPLIWVASALAIFAVGDALGPHEITLWKYFCCGAVASEIISRSNISSKASTALALSGFGVIWYDMQSGDDWIVSSIESIIGYGIRSPVSPPDYTITLCFGVIMMLVGTVRSRFFRTVLESAPLRVMGAVSYSLFMWHSFMIAASFPVTFNGNGGITLTGPIPSAPVIALPLIIIPALIAVATISYIAIERPFLIFRRQRHLVDQNGAPEAAKAVTHPAA